MVTASLDNVMTLEPTIHYFFDRLIMWFEAVVSDIKFSSPLTLNMRRKYLRYTCYSRRLPFLVQDKPNNIPGRKRSRLAEP